MRRNTGKIYNNNNKMKDIIIIIYIHFLPDFSLLSKYNYHLNYQ